MRTRFTTAVICSILALLAPGAARAELERVGPTDPTNGFPQWYQDRTGVALELCQPQNQAELDGGWCLLLPADTTAPESFPTSFSEEHFWWAADANLAFVGPTGLDTRANLVLALEAAFAQGAVVPGDQLAFGRIRLRLDPVPYDGEYVVYTPYTVWRFLLVAGQRLFYTEDIGITCPPGQFDCALSSSVGPFLVPADVPGGPELPPVAGPVPGKLYLADPARAGPVTGSPRADFVASDGLPRNHNLFRIEGPNGFAVETTSFTVVGRIFTGQLPGRVHLDRATLVRNADEGARVDVFATAFATQQSRLPASPPPPAVTPVLAFYPAPCAVGPTGALGEPAGVAGVPMFSRGSAFWGQGPVAIVPPAVCVEDYTSRDAAGQVISAWYEAPVTDLVSISDAVYDPATAQLLVRAQSSDSGNQTLTLVGYGTEFATEALVAGIPAPPARVRVRSSGGGFAERDVSTLRGALTVSSLPVAGNDTITVAEDSAGVDIPVLANDTVGSRPVVYADGNVVLNIVVAPRLGTAAVTADGQIRFQPFPDTFGTDGIAYTITVAGVESPAAYVTIVIPNTNDAPVAVNDAAASVAGIATSLDVLANDTDVDGKADLARAVVVGTLPAGVTVADGPTLSFTAATAGTYAIAYQAEDAAGARSADATVTVTVAAAETVAITVAEYRASQARLRVDGTSNVAQGQTVSLTWANGTAAGTEFARAVVDPTGAWTVDLRPAPDPRATGATRVRATSALGGSGEASIRFR